MGSIRISDATVVALTCPPGRKDVLFFDVAVKGFGLRVTATGTRVFLYQYRVGTTVRRQPLGHWPTTTAAQARRLAETHRGKVKGGGDPVADQRAKRAAAAAQEAKARAEKTTAAFTFGRLVNEWEISLAHRRLRYVHDAVTRLRTYNTEWRDRAAGGITRSDAVASVDKAVTDRGIVSARRMIAYGRACYGWANRRGLVTENPFHGIAAPGKETPRDRVLNEDEVRAIWRAAEGLGPFYGPYVRILLLTLQRREEVAGMRWTELSPDMSTWTVPADRAKNGRAHLVHLPVVARGILREIPRLNSTDLVFPGQPRRSTKAALPAERSISGFSNAKADLDAAIAVERAAAGLTPVRLPNWRFHDFRRTGVTALAGLGFAPHVCDRLLNHLTGAIQGVAAVYQRAEFLAERREALEAWVAVVSRN